MQNCFNKTVLIGRLYENPVCNSDCASFEVLNTIFRDGKEETIRHKISSYGKQAKLVMKYLNKGDLCCIEGSLGDSGIICERLTFLKHKREN
jgi:single-stranded DNA-binding protein